MARQMRGAAARGAAALLAAALGACGGGGAASGGGTGARQLPRSVFVVDGFVLWNTSMDEAPRAIQEVWGVGELMLAAFEEAPVRSANADRTTWYRDICEPYWAKQRERIDPRAEKLAAMNDEEKATVPEYPLVSVLVDLMVQERSARYLERAGFEPIRGGCEGGPEAWLAQALARCRDAAQSCVDRSPGIAGPLGGNAEECRKRGAWCSGELEGAKETVCEPPTAGG